DDRRLAQNLSDQRIGAAAKGRREDAAVFVDHEDVGLALVGAQLVDLVLEFRGVGGEQMIRQAEALPARVVAIEAALEIAGNRGEPTLAARSHADRIEL